MATRIREIETKTIGYKVTLSGMKRNSNGRMISKTFNIGLSSYFGALRTAVELWRSQRPDCTPLIIKDLTPIYEHREYDAFIYIGECA